MNVPARLQAIYEAYRDKRLADVLSRLDETFVLVINAPDTVIPGGDRPRDKAETEDALRGYMEAYDFLSFDPGPIIVTGEQATAHPQVRYRHKETGKILETKFRHLWLIRADKIVGLDVGVDVEQIAAFMESLARHGG